MLHLRREPVNGRVAGSELAEGGAELHGLLEVGRPLATGVRVNEVRNRRGCPRRVDDLRDFHEIGGRQLGLRIALARAGREELPEGYGLHRGHAHALTVDRIEAADRVADRQDAAWEALYALVVAEHAFVKAEARDVAQTLRVLDRVVDGRRPQSLRVLHDPRLVAGRNVTVTAPDGGDPALALERQHERSPAGPADAREAEHAFPVFWRIVGNREHGGGIGEIDADRGLGGRDPAEGGEGIEREHATAGGGDHQIGVDGFWSSRRVGITDSRGPGRGAPVRRWLAGARAAVGPPTPAPMTTAWLPITLDITRLRARGFEARVARAEAALPRRNTVAPRDSPRS